MGTKSVNHTLIEIKKATASLRDYLDDRERRYIWREINPHGGIQPRVPPIFREIYAILKQKSKHNF
jgi:hypothetical protein